MRKYLAKNKAIPLIVLFVLLLLFQSCASGDKKQKEPGTGEDSPDISVNSPSKILEAHNQALLKGDFDTPYDLLSKRTRERIKKKDYVEKLQELMKNKDMREELSQTEITGEKVEGDVSYVTIEFPLLGNPDNKQTKEIKLVKEDGEWRMGKK